MKADRELLQFSFLYRESRWISYIKNAPIKKITIVCVKIPIVQVKWVYKNSQ